MAKETQRVIDILEGCHNHNAKLKMIAELFMWIDWEGGNVNFGGGRARALMEIFEDITTNIETRINQAVELLSGGEVSHG